MWLVFARFFQYRKKYHEKREEVKVANAEVEDMEMFGTSHVGDPDVDMVSNPLSRQISDMRGVVGIGGVDNTADVEKAQQESAERQGEIQYVSSLFILGCCMC